MTLLKIMAKIILLTVAAVLTVAQWVGIFLNSISGVVMGILSFVFAMTALASLIIGLASGAECLRMMVTAFVIFLVPHIGNWLIERIIQLRYLIGDYIRS